MKCLLLFWFLFGVHALSGSGRATWYAHNDGNAPVTWSTPGACGRRFLPKDKWYVALSGDLYKQEHCGKCLQVEGYGKCFIVEVVDECPECCRGCIDLYFGAFAAVVGSESRAVELGVFKESFVLIDCPNKLGIV